MSPDRQGPTRFGSERFPRWLRSKDKVFLLGVLAKEPVQLNSPDMLGKRLVSMAEIEDINEVVSRFKDPILIGVYGSRATLKRPPLFQNVDEFDLYHKEESWAVGGLQGYLRGEGVSMSDYQLARRYVETGEFNEGYRQGQQYPEPLVRLLVRDIDLLIITKEKNNSGGPFIGRRTNVIMDINTNTPLHNPLHYAYPNEDSPGLGKIIPLVF